MTSREYEKVVHDIAAALYEVAENMQAEKLGYGSSNKLAGISGFNHQIDVSIASKNDLILIECKRWNQRVEVPAFLTFLARILDIKAQETRRAVHPIVVTTIGFEEGVRTLANYYKIQLQVVRSASEFAMKYKNVATLGTSGTISPKGSLTIEKYDANGNLIDARALL